MTANLVLMSQIVKDYESLQTHDFHGSEDTKRSSPDTTFPADEHNESRESEVLVSLTLGRGSSSNYSPNCKKDREKKISNNISHGQDENQDENDDQFHEGLALGLGPVDQFLTADNNKGLDEELTTKSSVIKRRADPQDDHDLLENPGLKKARVSVRTLCDTPTMNDGCQWRKYGQKISKGNPWPRAYYRCTISSSCPVRKQVQRCSEDTAILITTYEGTHNHPLPASATAMASTTSAAASMLRSASSTSQPGGRHHHLGASAAAAKLHGSLTNITCRGPHPLYFPNTTISSTSLQPHPTITLDLTAKTPNSHFNGLTTTTSTFPSSFSSAPRYSSVPSLNFYSSSSSSSSSCSSKETPQSIWGNGYFSYGTVMSNTRNHTGSSNYGKQPHDQESLYQNYNLLKNNQMMRTNLPSTETIASATKAITSNPAFQSALAAAITSFVRNSGTGVPENQGGGENQPVAQSNAASNIYDYKQIN